MSRTYTEEEVKELIASLNPVPQPSPVNVLCAPAVLKLQTEFSDLLKKLKVLKEHRLICPEVELDRNMDAIDDLRLKMEEIDEHLHGKFDVWISWNTGQIMTWDQKHPWYKTFVADSQRVG